MRNYTIQPFISEQEIKSMVTRIASQINKDYQDEEVLLVGLLRGSFIFLSDLVRQLTVEASIDFMVVSSYIGMESSREAKVMKDLDENIANRNVIIIEDIIDTGHTLVQVIKMLKTRQPKSLRVCTLLDKPERRETNITSDYVGMVIPDEFVVGYGIDYNQKHRTRPDIGIIIKEKV